MLEPAQIVRSAQVWVCDACGCQDNKSCSCNSTAHMEALAAKKEAHRQANRRSYEKAQQNQQPSDNPTPVDNITELASDEYPTDYQSPWTAHGQAPPDTSNGVGANRYIRKLLSFMVDFSNEFRDWLPKADLSADDKEALTERLQSCANDLVLLSQEIEQ